MSEEYRVSKAIPELTDIFARLAQLDLDAAAVMLAGDPRYDVYHDKLLDAIIATANEVDKVEKVLDL